MPISMHRAIRHMSWANQKVYASFTTLPDEALDAYITNPEWTARHLLQHIVSGSDWYVYCLGIAPWNDIRAPKTIGEIAALAQTLASCDAKILSAADLDEELLTFSEGDRTVKVQRSTLLAEAILHATEHRAQLMDAIESRGFSTISLDSIDLWAFEYFERKGV
jgi:uncharacterized damage-inducible protein DinB